MADGIDDLPAAIKKSETLTHKGARFVGSIIEAWMYEKVKSRADITSSTGIRSGNLSMYINDKMPLMPKTIEKIAKVFRLTEEEFLAGPQITDAKQNDNRAGVGGFKIINSWGTGWG